MTKTITIIGGGIAATSCLEALILEHCQETQSYDCITLISATTILKKVTNLNVRGRNLESFDVVEYDSRETLGLSLPKDLKYEFVLGKANCVDSENKTVIVSCDEGITKKIRYDKLCICTGSSPKILDVCGTDNPDVKKRLITIRDTDSVQDLDFKLRSARRVLIVGNGGISLELAYKISGCEKVWIVRDEFIGLPFLDSAASEFLINSKNSPDSSDNPSKPQYLNQSSSNSSTYGPALGPHWLQGQSLIGINQTKQSLKVIYQCFVNRIDASKNNQWPLTVVLSNGESINCDYIISAIGVAPNSLSTVGPDLERSLNDGGLLVDNEMRTSLSDIYAAGDAVSCEKWPASSLWFQMRLWTQARQMGYYCGRCIASHMAQTDAAVYFNFDCFTHITRFFGQKVVLLGHYNLQGEQHRYGGDIEVLVRSNPNQDYMKLVIKDNRVIGATIVGDSGLEETIENLICDKLDIGSIKESLLDNNVDIEDYFD